MDSEGLETRDTGEKETDGMRRTEDEDDDTQRGKQIMNRRTVKQEG